MTEFRDKLGDTANVPQLIERSVKLSESLSLPQQEIFMKYLLTAASHDKVPFEQILQLKEQGKLNKMPHLLVEADIMELARIRDEARKVKLFKEAFARLPLINNKPTQNHYEGMLNMAYGNYSLRLNEMDRAKKSFESAIVAFEKNITINRQELEKMSKHPPEEDSEERVKQMFELRLNGLKEMLRGYIEKIGEACSDLFIIHYDVNEFDKSEKHLKKGLDTFELFPGVKMHSPIYFQLEKLMLEMRTKYKKEDPSTLVRDYQTFYEKAKTALGDALTDSHLYTLFVCMVSCAKNKMVLLGKEKEIEEQVDKAIEDLTSSIGEEKSMLLQNKLKQAQQALDRIKKQRKQKAPQTEAKKP